MSDNGVGVSRRYVMDFSTPEFTMKQISETSSDIANELSVEGEKLGNMEVDLEAFEAQLYNDTRMKLAKPTEGQLANVISADSRITALRKAVVKQKMKVAHLGRQYDITYNDRRIFMAWYEGQNRRGM